MLHACQHDVSPIAEIVAYRREIQQGSSEDFCDGMLIPSTLSLADKPINRLLRIHLELFEKVLIGHGQQGLSASNLLVEALNSYSKSGSTKSVRQKAIHVRPREVDAVPTSIGSRVEEKGFLYPDSRPIPNHSMVGGEGCNISNGDRATRSF